MPRAYVATAISSALLLTALPAMADTVLQKARALSSDGPVYLFDMQYHDGTNRFQMTVDPTRESGDMIVAFSPDPAGLTGDASKKYKELKESTEGDIWCSTFAANIPETAKRVSETQTTASYTFTPLPGEEEGDTAKMFKSLEGSATIDKQTGAILSFGMVAPKPFKPAMAARIDRFDMKVDCLPAPDGRTHIDKLTLSLAGSALMQRFDQTETRQLSNLQPALQSGGGAP